MQLLPPSLDYWYPSTSFFFLAGPGPLHEIAVSAAFSRSPLGRANTFLFLLLLLAPHKSLLIGVLPPSPCFLSASLSLSPIFSSTSSVLYAAHFSMDRVSPLSFHTFSTTLRIPLFSSSPFCYFLPYSPIRLWLATSFLACSLLQIATSRFSRLFVLSGYIAITRRTF